MDFLKLILSLILLIRFDTKRIIGACVLKQMHNKSHVLCSYLQGDVCYFHFGTHEKQNNKKHVRDDFSIDARCVGSLNIVWQFLMSTLATMTPFFFERCTSVFDVVTVTPPDSVHRIVSAVDNVEEQVP